MDNEINKDCIVTKDDEISPSMKEWLREDDISDLNEKLYSTNSLLLNEDDEFMFDKFKRKCFSEVKTSMCFVILVFLTFSFILGCLAIDSSKDVNSLIILGLVFIFISFICFSFIYNNSRELKYLKEFFFDVIDLECCTVSGPRHSTSFTEVKLAFDLNKPNGLIEYGVIAKMIKLRHKVVEGDTLFLIKMKNRYYCYPSLETYKKMGK